MSIPLCLAILGAVQPPLHMYLSVVFRLAQGERVEELVGGFLTGMLAWALCAAVALFLEHRRPRGKGRTAVHCLSLTGLTLFAMVAVWFAAAPSYGG
ncbi:hypothetical protein N510_002530 [Firmicutes bacterium ASF500]|nr:hypothetical protein N510_002530 [Firmicutes bacterium ASF500]